MNGAGRPTDARDPLRLRPILKHRVWGGRGLEHFGHCLPEVANVGEAWVVADLPNSTPTPPAADTPADSNIIEGGSWEGRTLHDVLSTAGRTLLGEVRASAEGGFPLLVKLLDARENLSVQVHPTPAYAQRHPGTHVKDETWYVLHAEPGALIYRGLRRELDPAELRQRVLDGGIVEELIALPVHAGDVIDLPSGTCHALGAGIVVAEVQTPSDTTFRLFDWGRSGRALHVEQALEVLCGDGAGSHAGTVGLQRPRPTIDSGALRTTRLFETTSYLAELIEAPAADPGVAAVPVELPLRTDNRPVVLLPLKGTGRLFGRNQVQPLHRGHATLLPAALDGWSAELSPGTSLLRVEIPGPKRLADGREW